MLLRVLRRNFLKGRKDLRRCYVSSAKTEEEYTVTPQYPPILHISAEARREREKQSYYEEIKNVPTVEEKQIKLNMPKYYGFQCFLMVEDKAAYNTLPLMQHITRTHLIESSALPTYYDNINVDNIIESIKSDIEEIILLEYDGYIRREYVNNENNLSPKELEDTFSCSLVKQLNRFILNTLHKNNPHIANLDVDFSPRIESAWYAGGMHPTDGVKKLHKSKEWLKDTEKDPINKVMQALTYPSLTIRSDVPLKPIIPYNEAENPDFNVPFFEYDPRVLDTKIEYRRIANIPGYWPGEKSEFGVLSYHQRGYVLNRHYGDETETKETLHRQGILASFNWLNAQAHFLGFNTYNDLTYPLVNQTCITNGQLWSFYTYQLNTILVHSQYINENPKRNICWATGEMKLFENIKDNKVHGLNLDILKNIVKYYLNKPEERLGVTLRPYLNNNEKRIADYEDEEKRIWLEREYKFLTSNRPRGKLGYEVYHWEKIYKIDHQTRVHEKRRRPFELFINPYNRRLDDRKPNYVPKALRPHLRKNQGRDAKEYFP